MKHFATIVGLLATLTSAHMRMSYPPPINAIGNPTGGKLEDQREPISGSQFPCRGYHANFPNDAAQKTVAQWRAGSMQKITMIGQIPDGTNFQATHGGGSCQISFSTDGGETFRVVKSYIGNCPALHDNGGIDRNGDAQGSPVWNGYPFTVPKDLPSGPVLLAWTWFNAVGNREMYMNCAAVEITGSAGDDTIKFDERPEIFQANIDNGCATTANTDVDFPAPGPDVVVATDAKRSEPEGGEGACGKVDRSATEVMMTPQELVTIGCSATGQPVPAMADGNGAVPCDGIAAPAPAQADTVVAGGDRKLEAKPKTGAPAAPADDISADDAAPAVFPDAPAASVAPVAAAPTAAAPAAPADTPAPAGDASSGSTGSGGVMTGKCDTTGTWNCIDGKSFQQCASGAWSVSMAMAAGTACKPGMSATLEMVVLAKREVRFSNLHVRRHMGRHRS